MVSGREAVSKFMTATDETAVGLSGQERLVAELVCHGLSNKQIAARSGLSEHTVSSYLRRVYGKLGVRSRVGLVTFMHAAGYFDPMTKFPARSGV